MVCGPTRPILNPTWVRSACRSKRAGRDANSRMMKRKETNHTSNRESICKVAWPNTNENVNCLSVSLQPPQIWHWLGETVSSDWSIAISTTPFGGSCRLRQIWRFRCSVIHITHSQINFPAYYHASKYHHGIHVRCSDGCMQTFSSA